MKNKILTSFILGIFIFLSSFSLIKAVDLTVDCTPGSTCTISPASTPLFQEADWFPGSTITRNLLVKNEDSSQVCNLVMNTSNVTQEPADFATQLLTSIDNGPTNIFSGNLNNIFAASSISMGSINPASSTNYAWKLTFDPNAPNSYQNANTKFDFNLNFSCDVVSTGGGGSVAGASTSSSAPTCNSTTPASAPTLTGVSNSGNSANLSWTAVAPVDHYMIRYGTSSGNYIYGAANVGNVTNYLVQALSGGVTYYFQVAGVNNCAPGPWSNETSITVGGGVLAGPAQGFTQQTLGVSTEAPSATPNPTPEVLGTSTPTTCSAKYYYWWIPLVIQAVISFIYIWRRWKDKAWWVVVGLLAVFSQIIHEILGCNCATGGWCPKYWIFNLIIVSLSAGIYLYKSNTSKKEPQV